MAVSIEQMKLDGAVPSPAPLGKGLGEKDGSISSS
jgi:hypothetical protein